MIFIQLSERQERIIQIVKDNQPITSENIAEYLKLNRSTIRPDLSILTMAGILDAKPKVGYFFTGRTNLNHISDKIRDILVGDIQSMPIVLEESTSIYESLVFMFLEDVGSIYIINEGILSGVVSRKDLLKASIGGMDLSKTPVGVIMTRMPNIIFCLQKDSALSAAIKLIEHEIDSLPVVDILDENKKRLKVIGRITKTTITRLLVELGNNI